MPLSNTEPDSKYYVTAGAMKLKGGIKIILKTRFTQYKNVFIQGLKLSNRFYFKLNTLSISYIYLQVSYCDLLTHKTMLIKCISYQNKDVRVIKQVKE